MSTFNPSYGELFTGIGGMSLGLERAGWTPRWFAENDAYCSRVLAKHWPTIPNLGDVSTVDWSAVECPDLVAGGFPCQDVSDAGQHASPAGIDGERSGLWAGFARCIRDLRPGLVLVENVPGLLVRGMGRVLGDLAALGYDAEWDCVPAALVGANHLRTRVWILAYTRRVRRSPAPFRLPQSDVGGWWTREPAVERVAHGPADRVERALTEGVGNAVVPQLAEFIGRQLLEQLVSA